MPKNKKVSILPEHAILNHEIVGNYLEQSVEFFRDRIKKEMTFNCRRTHFFPGGGKVEADNYEINTNFGLLSISVVPDSMQWNRYIHLITMNHGKTPSSSDFEINIPRVHDRRVSALLTEKQGSRYICNRGKCTVYKRRLKMTEVLNYFAIKHGNVVEIQEPGHKSSVIQIAELESPILFEQIAEFTNQLKVFKQKFRI